MWDGGRRSGLGVALALACALLALAATPDLAGAASSYLAGAARVDTTPPLFDPAADAAAFPTCPAAVYTGPRVFGLNEPYADLDGNGEFSYQGVGQDAAPEPFCDANANDRYDGIYDSGGVDQLARSVHDPIDARAFAISDGQRSVVVVSVVAQGLFENYTAAIRERVAELEPGAAIDVVVSANHNESSPDTIGIYGGPEVGGVTGANSGIDGYYIDFLVERVAQAAAKAYENEVPADLAVSQFQVPADLSISLSHNFPTTDDARNPAAIDPKVRVLTATDASGGRIFTTMNLAAHNQEIGHSAALGRELSSDWPGYFHDRLEQLVGGEAIFLVGANGSEEDPITVPPVDQAAHPECSDGCYAQAEATGHAFAGAVAGHLDDAQPLRAGAVGVQSDEFFVPLENNLFKAAAAAGLFGERQTYEGGQPVGRSGNQLKTETDLVTVGPDLQLATNPGEAFPALIFGSPWGIEDVGCPGRPNPPAPAWHLSGAYRFQVGLANDLIGYEIPAWAYSSTPGAFRYEGAPDNGGLATCVNDSDDKDPAGHQHKLETEGAGPTSSNLVAEHLTALADAHPDPSARIGAGRFLYADGTTSRRAQRPVAGHGGGTENAVGVWLADPGSSTLEPGSGTIVAEAGIASFGSRPVEASGQFMDYDGQAQPAPDIATRGMLTPAADATATTGRFYLDVYPALTVSPLGAAQPASNGGGGGGPGAGPGDGQGGPGSSGAPGTPCSDSRAPVSRIDSKRFRLRRHSLRIAGSSVDSGCSEPGKASTPAAVRRVQVDVAKRAGNHRCRFLRPSGKLQHRAHRCSRPRELSPKGTARWRLRLHVRSLPKGRYVARARATDDAGNRERRPKRKAPNALRFRVR